jgi:hypothetical protein
VITTTSVTVPGPLIVVVVVVDRWVLGAGVTTFWGWRQTWVATFKMVWCWGGVVAVRARAKARLVGLTRRATTSATVVTSERGILTCARTPAA